MSSCNCGPIKKNVCQAGVFGVVRLGLTNTGIKAVFDEMGEERKGPSVRKRILIQTAAFGGSGVLYDMSVGAMIRNYTGAYSDTLVKSIYQVAVLGAVDVALRRKLKMSELLKGAISVAAANYGIEALDGLGSK